MIKAMQGLVGKRNVKVFKSENEIKNVFKNGELFYASQIIIGMVEVSLL